MSVTVVDRVDPRVQWVERTWLRFLLGEHAGATVEDPSGSFLVPGAVVVSQRPDLFTAAQLELVRRTPNVGLFHISDEWYHCRLETYDAFAFVWRQHAHSGLHAGFVRPLPLGPAAAEVIDVDLPASSRESLVGRRHLISFVGNLVSTRFATVRALSSVPGAFVRSTGAFDVRGDQMTREDYTTLLRDSVFVACPMGNGHLESFRVYEALEAGAIPVVETRLQLDYFSLLLGDHPLPTIRRWNEAPRLLRRLAEDPGLPTLEARVREWWRSYKRDLRCSIARDLQTDERDMRGSADLRARRLLEVFKHQNITSLTRRAQLEGLRGIRALRRLSR